MQAARAYDTYKMVKELIVLGFSEKQSEGVVNLFGQVQGDLVTKSDLQEVKAELKSDLQEVKAEIREVEMRLENRMLQLESGIIKWVLGVQVASLGITLAFLKFFL